MEDQYGASPTASLTAAQEWSLEALGNWKGFREDDDSTLDWDVLDQTRLHNKVNEIDDDDDHLPGDPINEGTITETQGDSWVVPGYDAAGNMLSGPKPGDEETRQHYKWDAWNRLVAVYADDDQNPGEPGDLVATYRYDGLNRRIQKIVEGSPDVTYDYYYNESWQIVEVRKGADTDPYEQFVWDARYIDAPVVRFRDGNTDGDLTGGTVEGDNTLYFTNDANMNVTALVDASDGAVVERYMYDPYGKPTVLNGVRDSTGTSTTEWDTRSSNTFQNAILYCGYFFDDESGLYHVRRRPYNFALGRWPSWDPSGYADGMSLYEYVRSRAISLVDPVGNEAASSSVDYGDGGPCCCTSDEDCEIVVEWTSQPQAYTPYPEAKAPTILEGATGVRVSTSTIRKTGYWDYTIQAFVTVSVRSKQIPPKPVGGCHLVQDVVTWNPVASTAKHTKNDYGPSMGPDYEPELKGVQNQVGRTVYRGHRFDDAPGLHGFARADRPGGLGYFFEGYVYVNEATSVDKWYGFWALVQLQDGKPTVKGRTWVDDESHHAFNPTQSVLPSNVSGWQGPAPLDVRSGLGPGDLEMHYMVE